MQENLKKKYGITDEELIHAIEQISLEKIACNGITIVALTDLLCNGDITPPALAVNHKKGEPTTFTSLTTDKPHTMREFIKEHFDEILDKFFQKNVFCCLCQYEEECVEELEKCRLTPCSVKADIPGEKYLNSPATPENIAKLKEIYEELF